MICISIHWAHWIFGTNYTGSSMDSPVFSEPPVYRCNQSYPPSSHGPTCAVCDPVIYCDDCNQVIHYHQNCSSATSFYVRHRHALSNQWETFCADCA